MSEERLLVESAVWGTRAFLNDSGGPGAGKVESAGGRGNHCVGGGAGRGGGAGTGNMR